MHLWPKKIIIIIIILKIIIKIYHSIKKKKNFNYTDFFMLYSKIFIYYKSKNFQQWYSKQDIRT